MTQTSLRALHRAAALLFTSALTVLVFAGPAMASTATVHLKDAHQNTTAADFGEHECSDDQLPRLEGQDGWHFVLPTKRGAKAVFVSLTLTFEDENGETQVKNIPGDGTVGPPTAKHAVLHTPEGWTLIEGSAEITGQENGEPSEFNLSHTCPAEAPGSPSETPGDSPTDVPTDAPTEEPSEEPTTEPSEVVSEQPSESEAPGEGGDLPVTGIALTGIVLTGLGMVGAGIAMRALRRKNEDGDESTES
ncbi:MAG: hypothetical protein ACRDUA_09490 [Micromonosporaceae bacterium]